MRPSSWICLVLPHSVRAFLSRFSSTDIGYRSLSYSVFFCFSFSFLVFRAVLESKPDPNLRTPQGCKKKKMPAALRQLKELLCCGC